MKIVTNNLPRALYSFNDLSTKLKNEFDYLTSDMHFDNRFVFYKGQCHDMEDTQRIEVKKEHVHPMGWAMYVEPTDALAKWSRVISDSYFSGILFRTVDEERVVVGRYFS